MDAPIGCTILGRKKTMNFADIYHRRPQHVGVINQAVWSAHAR